MLELLIDLDRGVDKLPRGSEIILLNMHDTEEISKHVKRLGRWNGLAVRHVKGNPLHIEDLKKVRESADPGSPSTHALCSSGGHSDPPPNRCDLPCH